MKPPKRSAPGLEISGAAKLRLLEDYRSPIPAQACFSVWKRETARLFNEYWRTADKRHLAAFITHVVAMRIHAGRHTP
jgi:hypothetical protein